MVGSGGVAFWGDAGKKLGMTGESFFPCPTGASLPRDESTVFPDSPVNCGKAKFLSHAASLQNSLQALGKHK